MPGQHWASVQQDVDEALGVILNTFDNREDSFWKIGTGRITEKLDQNRVRSGKKEWERALSLGLEVTATDSYGTALSIPELIQRSFQITRDTREETDGTKTEFQTWQEVIRAPSTLIIQLKRFEYHANSGASKNHRKVEIPIELSLNESEFVQRPEDGSLELAPQRSVRYVLRGVIEHTGSTAHEGHYRYFQMKEYRSEQSGLIGQLVEPEQWIVHDDEIVSVESLNEQSYKHIYRNAYLLFYEKVVN